MCRGSGSSEPRPDYIWRGECGCLISKQPFRLLTRRKRSFKSRCSSPASRYCSNSDAQSTRTCAQLREEKATSLSAGMFLPNSSHPTRPNPNRTGRFEPDSSVDMLSRKIITDWGTGVGIAGPSSRNNGDAKLESSASHSLSKRLTRL